MFQQIRCLFCFDVGRHTSVSSRFAHWVEAGEANLSQGGCPPVPDTGGHRPLLSLFQVTLPAHLTKCPVPLPVGPCHRILPPPTPTRRLCIPCEVPTPSRAHMHRYVWLCPEMWEGLVPWESHAQPWGPMAVFFILPTARHLLHAAAVCSTPSRHPPHHGGAAQRHASHGVPCSHPSS